MPPVKWCGAACECGNWSRGRFANRGGACISGVRISRVCITQCDPRKTGRAFYRLAGRCGIGRTEAHGPQGVTWVSVAMSLYTLPEHSSAEGVPCLQQASSTSAPLKSQRPHSLVGRSVSPRAAVRSVLPTPAWSGKAVHQYAPQFLCYSHPVAGS